MNDLFPFTGLLALGFLAPWLLWGMTAAAAPWIVHWLFRQRYRPMPWGAMQFLLAATRQTSHWSRLDQWWLLLLRTLIPLCAALALAGPLREFATGAARSAPMHRLLVLDHSLSTQADEEGRTRWSRIRDAAADLVSNGRPGDTWQLMTLGGRTPRALISEPAFSPNPVLEELQQLTPTSQTAAVVEGLSLATELLANVSTPRKEVYLLTDGQRATWHPANEATREQLATGLARLSEQGTVYWKDVSTRTRGNVAVTHLELTQRYVLTNQPLRAVATLRRIGDVPWPATLEWKVDGRLVASQPLDATAGAEQQKELRYVPTSAGELRLEASIAADGLPVDDRRYAVCVVRDSLKILLVDGRPSGVPFANATDCIRLALAPGDTATPGGRLQPTVISDGQLISTPLNDFDIVWLCDIARPTDREADLLRQFTSQGGGLVISLGPSARPEVYNQVFGKKGDALLPAHLEGLVGDPRQRDRSYTFDGQNFSHPIVSPFRGNPNTGFELTQTFAYLRSRPEPGAEVAVRFDSGDPAIIDQRYGRGRVLLVTTAADRTWGTWAVWGHTFVPMLHETVRYLMETPLGARQLETGEPLMAPFPVQRMSEQVVVRAPGNRQVNLSPTSQNGLSMVVFEETDEPGFYGLDATNVLATARWFAVNPPPVESNLTPLSLSELRDDLFQGRPINPPEEAATSVTSLTGPTEDSSLPRWLLAAVLVLVIIEPVFAWSPSLALTIAASFVALAIAGSLNSVPLLVATGFVMLAIVGWQVWNVTRSTTVTPS